MYISSTVKAIALLVFNILYIWLMAYLNVRTENLWETPAILSGCLIFSGSLVYWIGYINQWLNAHEF